MQSKLTVPSVAVFVCLFVTAAAPAAVIRVRADAPTGTRDGVTWDTAYRTVQAGIDACSPGDEVWVSGGPYSENITLKAGIGLYGGFNRSEAARELRAASARSALDGGKKSSVVTIPTGANGVVVDGFTISNGLAPQGGGIYCVADNVTISNNVISGNAASGNALNGYYGGGGIYQNAHKGVIVDNSLEGNTGIVGAGIWCVGASIVHNQIRFNTAYDGEQTSGAGVYTSGPVDIRDNLIYQNLAAAPSAFAYTGTSASGGGIFCTYASGVIARNLICGNGAVACSSVPGYGLLGAAVGGGLLVEQYGTSSLLVTDNLIVNNFVSAADTAHGAGVYAWGDALAFRNNTVYGNTGSAPVCGPAIEIYPAQKTVSSIVENNVFANNAAGSGVGIGVPAGHNCFHANGAGDPLYSGLNGNFDADPMLASPDGLDFRPMPGSPCIDAGNNAGVLSAETDRDGHPRVQGAAVDIGAYEAAVAIPYGMATVARALRIAAGITVPTADDFARMNAVKAGEMAPTIDLLDAVWLVRHEIDEESAIASLRILVAAQEQYRAQQNPPTYASNLPQLGRRISGPLASGVKDGYCFVPTYSAFGTSYGFGATPVIWPALAGVRSFYVDQTGVIRFEESGIGGNSQVAWVPSPWLP